MASRLKSVTRRSGFALFALAARSLQQVGALVITLLAARFLLPAEFGVYSVAIVFITLIQTMTYSGYYQYIVTSKAEDSKVLSTCFWTITGLATGSAALLVLAAYPLSIAFDAADLALVLILLAAIQPFAGAGAWSSAALLRRQDVKTHFVVIFIQNLLALIGGVMLLLHWQSIYALVAYRALRVLTGTILYLFLSSDRPSFRFDRDVARDATSFSGGLYGSRLMHFMSRYSADLLLGIVFTTAETGLYRFGNRVASGATDIVSQPTHSFALTQFAHSARNDQSLENPLERFSGSRFLLAGIVAAVIIVMGREVVGLLFNPAYMAALTVTYAMAVGATLTTVGQLVETSLAARGRTGIVFWYNLGAAILTTAVVFLTAPMGLEVLAWGQVGSALVLAIVAMIVIRRYAGIAVGKAVRNIAVAALVTLCFGLILEVVWHAILNVWEPSLGSISAGLIAAALLALGTLAAGRQLKVFSLSIFSG